MLAHLISEVEVSVVIHKQLHHSLIALTTG